MKDFESRGGGQMPFDGQRQQPPALYDQDRDEMNPADLWLPLGDYTDVIRGQLETRSQGDILSEQAIFDFLSGRVRIMLDEIQSVRPFRVELDVFREELPGAQSASLRLSQLISANTSLRARSEWGRIMHDADQIRRFGSRLPGFWAGVAISI